MATRNFYFKSDPEALSLAADGSCSDTTDRTVLGSVDIDPNFLNAAVGRALEVEIAGVIRTNDATPNLTLRFLLGDVVISTFGGIFAPGAANTGPRPWRASCVVNTRATGATGSIGFNSHTSGLGGVDANGNSSVNIADTPTAIDVTSMNKVVVDALWDAAHANNLISVTQMLVKPVIANIGS